MVTHFYVDFSTRTQTKTEATQAKTRSFNRARVEACSIASLRKSWRERKKHFTSDMETSLWCVHVACGVFDSFCCASFLCATNTCF